MKKEKEIRKKKTKKNLLVLYLKTLYKFVNQNGKPVNHKRTSPKKTLCRSWTRQRQKKSIFVSVALDSSKFVLVCLV